MAGNKRDRFLYLVAALVAVIVAVFTLGSANGADSSGTHALTHASGGHHRTTVHAGAD